MRISDWSSDVCSSDLLHYQLIELAQAKGLAALLDAARAIGFAGVNVTHPFKQAVAPLLVELSDDARAIGAVNTVVFEAAGGTARSEERSVGKACGSTGRSRWVPYN